MVVFDVRPGTVAVVAVEGTSDRLALDALARRRGVDLEAAEIAVVAMGGASNIGHLIRQFGPQGSGLRVAGLCDAAEERLFRRALRSAGIRPGADREDLEAVGFFVCDVDLEDEMIRAQGVDGMLKFLETQGDLHSFRVVQQMPHQRERTVEQQLRRFVGTRGGRKNLYAPLLVEKIEIDKIPRPLDALLDFVVQAGRVT
jgi:hypothetical protein